MAANGKPVGVDDVELGGMRIDPVVQGSPPPPPPKLIGSFEAPVAGSKVKRPPMFREDETIPQRCCKLILYVLFCPCMTGYLVLEGAANCASRSCILFCECLEGTCDRLARCLEVGRNASDRRARAREVGRPD